MLEAWRGSEELPVYGYLIRAIIVYVYIFVILKILGQRSIGTLHPLDFLFSIIIGDVLGEPLSTGNLPLAGPIAAAGLISTLHLILSYTALKTPRFRRVLEDEPIILIQKGQILNKQLAKTKVTVESLLMDLRLKNADIDEVDYAVLESNGQISIIKKSEAREVTLQDMQIPTSPKGYNSVIVLDGKIVHPNLRKVGSVQWLKDQLHARGIEDIQQVFLCTIDEGGKIYVSQKT